MRGKRVDYSQHFRSATKATRCLRLLVVPPAPPTQVLLPPASPGESRADWTWGDPTSPLPFPAQESPGREYSLSHSGRGGSRPLTPHSQQRGQKGAEPRFLGQGGPQWPLQAAPMAGFPLPPSPASQPPPVPQAAPVGWGPGPGAGFRSSPGSVRRGRPRLEQSAPAPGRAPPGARRASGRQFANTK